MSHKSQTLDVGWRRGGVYLCASFSTARHRGGNIGPLRCCLLHEVGGGTKN
nr:MAG TPA: hypothetical protein [Caudoviricetes sp.]